MTEERYLTDEETKNVVLELRRLFRRAKAENSLWDEEDIKISIKWSAEEIIIYFSEPNSETLWFGGGFARTTTIFKNVRDRHEDMLKFHYVEDMAKHRPHLSETDISNAKGIIRSFLECYQDECDEAMVEKYIG